jgi:hypothetical protein
MYFAMGIAVTAVAAWSLSAWQASAEVGADESTFVAVSPTRILDTREDIGLPGPFVSADPQDLQVTGTIATKSGTGVVVPDGATGVVLNVTVVQPTGDGFVSIRPADAPGVPTTSSLNFAAGDIIPNSVTVQMPTSGGDAGKIEITYDAFGNAGPTTEMLIDVVGYTKNAGLASLQAQVNALQALVNAATAPDAVGQDQIAPGGVGESEIAPGAINNTHIANNSLTVDNLGPNSVGNSELINGSVGISKLGAVIVDNALIPEGVEVANDTCGAAVSVPAVGAPVNGETLALASLLLGTPTETEWAVEGLPVTVAGQARVRLCNFSTNADTAPAVRVSLIVLRP